MRRLLFVISILTSINCFAKGYVDKFFEDGKYWMVEKNYYIVNKSEFYKMIVDGDTIVNGIQAKKIRKEWCETGITEEIYIGYEKDDIVYLYFDGVYSDGSGRFHPILNFNVIEGSKLWVRYWDSLHIDDNDIDDENFSDVFEYDINVCKIENLCINGVSRKIIFFEETPWSDFAWIEGIGVLGNVKYDSLVTYQLPACPDDEINVQKIYGCYKNDECIFLASDMSKYLNPEPGLGAVNEIGVDTEHCDEPIYDLMGRKVGNPQPGNIYVTPSGKRLYR